ncbi:MAG TPA: hypothetical protein VGN97_17620 [Mesorhizobium sp.]|jgi:hypothetical protein|nr:hypothetical protein [Mesorhizobium sp.]
MAEPKQAGTPSKADAGKEQPAREADGSFTDPGFMPNEPVGGAAGLATTLQPGGTLPGGGPATSEGSIGTGGGQTADRDSGSLKRDGR